MKIGIQTRLWGFEMNRAHLPALLQQVATAGYAGFEIGVQHLDLTRPKEFHHLLKANGVELASVHIAGQYDQPALAKAALDDAECAVEFASATGACFVTISGCEHAHKPLEEIQDYAERLNSIGEMCSQTGMRLCHHNHYWEILQDCRELKALCKMTDPSLVSLCLDIGWAQRAGGDAVEISRTFLDRVGYFHLRDAIGDRWVPLGRGQVDYPALFELIRVHPSPWQVVEQELPVKEIGVLPLSIAFELREYLRVQHGV